MADDRHHRRSIRLRGYDYRRRGMYFVTICTHDREHIFGEIRNGIMGLNEYGCIAADELQKTPIIRPSIKLGAWIIMPNHIHVIFHIIIDDARATRRVAPTTLPAQSLGSAIGQFKSIVTKRINILRDSPTARVWQRNYHDHIIRSRDEYDRIRRYIQRNPKKWSYDRNAIHE